MKTYKELKEHLEDLNEVDYAGMSNVAKKGASKVLKTLAKANKAKSAVKQVADQAAKGIKNNAGKIAAAGAVAGGLALASPAVRQDSQNHRHQAWQHASPRRRPTRPSAARCGYSGAAAPC